MKFETDTHAVVVFEGGILTIWQDGLNFDNYLGGDRMTYAYRILNLEGAEIHSDDDIQAPAFHKPIRAMRSLLSFLLACVESKTEESENYSLFPPATREWAEQWSDELQMIDLELGDE